MNDTRLVKLVRAAKTGKQRHITELYNQTKDYAYYVARHYVPACDIPDVLQEAYIAVFQNLQTFDETREFKPWLHTIVRNKSIDFLKRTTRQPFAYDVAVDYLADDNSLPGDLLEREEARRDVQQIINNLSVGQRTAVTLFYLEGISISEISQILNISDGTVKKQLYLARKAIREAVLTEELEHDNKLYGAAAIPFLTQLFEKQLEYGEYTMPAELSSQVLGTVMESITAGGILQGTEVLSWLTGGKLLVAATATLCAVTGGGYLYARQQKASTVPPSAPQSSARQEVVQQPILVVPPSASPGLPDAAGPGTGVSQVPPSVPQPSVGFITNYQEWYARYSTEKVERDGQWFTQEELDRLLATPEAPYDPQHQVQQDFFAHAFATLEEAVAAYPNAFAYTYHDGYLPNSSDHALALPDTLTNGWPYYLVQEADENRRVFDTKEEAMAFLEENRAREQEDGVRFDFFQNQQNGRWCILFNAD